MVDNQETLIIQYFHIYSNIQITRIKYQINVPIFTLSIQIEDQTDQSLIQIFEQYSIIIYIVLKIIIESIDLSNEICQFFDIQQLAISKQDKCLGIRIEYYISLNYPKFDINTTRYYCPISRIYDVGMFDLLIHAIQTEIRSFLLISILIGWAYSQYQWTLYQLPLQWIWYNRSPQKQYKFKLLIYWNICRIINNCTTNGDNKHIGLLYVVDTLDELVLMEELIWYMEEKKINTTFLLKIEQNSNGKVFSGPKRQLKPIYLQQYLPQPNDQHQSLFMVVRLLKKKLNNNWNISITKIQLQFDYILLNIIYNKIFYLIMILSNQIQLINCEKYLYPKYLQFTLFIILQLKGSNHKLRMSQNTIQNERVRQYQKVHQIQKEQLQHLVFRQSYSIKSASKLLNIKYATAKSIISKIRKLKIKKYLYLNKKLGQCQFKKVEFSKPQLEIQSLVSGTLISSCQYYLY
ncbi:unnamed protein product [Paramecium primaurelia]|uniref:Flavoprotein pyridine nucleotide cytochrome reductase-like FAD-binding domain-containing protein n=2 Tax=Paramecium primaurelia TaxID=5886 RepID=A0A8S1PR47_PARPR|nr:unnamed protein product [Paramecium primaurelia]